MTYKNKYLKYKSKYLELKKQFGGTYGTTINLVTSSGNKKYDLVNGFVQDINVFKNIMVQKNENENINSINDQAQLMYSNARNHKNYNVDDFVSLYDNIGALYICSEPIQYLWNQLALDIQLNIAIFNGDNDNFRYLKPTNYIVGINILSGCKTQSKAQELNTTENNSAGKYFIGFNGLKHNYGSSFYTCGENRLTMTNEEFITEYDKYSDELPIIKIIKIFHDKFKHCQTCRNCDIITIDKIKEKLQFLKIKIDTRANFNSKRDNYFDSSYHINCIPGNCNIDSIFEKYFRDKITKIIDDQEKLAIKKEEEKSGKQLKRKEWETEREKLVLVTDNDTNITKDYDKFFESIDIYFIGKMISYNESTETVTDGESHYKIYLKKSKTNDEYYKFEEYEKSLSSTHGVFFVDKNLVYLNEDGSKMPEAQADWG